MVLKLKKPKIIILDVTGPVATRAFMNYSQESKQFMKQYIRDFVIECWGKREFRLAVNFVRAEQEQDLIGENKTNKPVPRSRYQETKSEKVDPSDKSKMPLLADLKATTEEQAESLIANLMWRLDNPKRSKSPALGIFQMHMSEWGYKKGFLKTPVYEDSPPTLKKWKKDNIKIYVSFGTVSFLQLIFTNTISGNLFELISGNLNLMEGNRKNFSNVSEIVGEPFSKILFITRLPFDARIAQKMNIKTVIIVREDFDPDAAAILKTIELKRKKKRERSQSLSGGEASKGETGSQENVEDPKKSKTLVPVEDSDLSTASKITAKDIRDFPVITRLDDLIWE